jgi:hypothetical protein
MVTAMLAALWSLGRQENAKCKGTSGIVPARLRRGERGLKFNAEQIQRKRQIQQGAKFITTP